MRTELMQLVLRRLNSSIIWRSTRKQPKPHAMTPRQLGNNHRHQRHQIDDKVGQIVVCVVGAQQEQGDGHAEQELLGRRVLVAIVNLLPHVEVVVGAGVELEGNAAHVVEHQVRAEHVADVGQGPGDFLGYAGDDVEEDLEGHDEHKVDCPCAWWS